LLIFIKLWLLATLKVELQLLQLQLQLESCSSCYISNH
jgi:hypothetical protein